MALKDEKDLKRLILHGKIANSLLLRDSNDIYLLNDVLIGNITDEMKENLKLLGVTLIEEKAYLCG